MIMMMRASGERWRRKDKRETWKWILTRERLRSTCTFCNTMGREAIMLRENDGTFSKTRILASSSAFLAELTRHLDHQVMWCTRLPFSFFRTETWKSEFVVILMFFCNNDLIFLWFPINTKSYKSIYCVWI